MTSFFSSKKSPKETLSSLSKFFQTKVKKTKPNQRLSQGKPCWTFILYLAYKNSLLFLQLLFLLRLALQHFRFQHRCVLFNHVICKHRCDSEMCASDQKLIEVDEKEVSEKAMATHSSTLAWKIPWTEEPGGLQSMGSLGVGHD